MSDWQPIESAPKDCTRILVWIDPGYITVGYWSPDNFARNPRPFWGIELHSTKTMQRRMQPTHWMPLPASRPIAPKATP